MGVTFQAEGLAYEDSYDCGYITLGAYKLEVARRASPLAGALYRKWAFGYLDDFDRGDGNEVTDMGDKVVKAQIFVEDLAQDADPPTIDDVAEEAETAFPGHVTRPMRSEVDITVTMGELDSFLRETVGDAVMGCLLYAPDTEGRLEPDECTELLADLDRLFSDREAPQILAHNYGETTAVVDERGCPRPRIRHYLMHEQMRGMLRHCAERGVPLIWF